MKTIISVSCSWTVVEKKSNNAEKIKGALCDFSTYQH